MTDQQSTPTFADALIALGLHIKNNENLPQAANVGWRFYRPVEYRDGLDIQLPTKSSTTDLAAWAATLTDVSSDAWRYESGGVHAFVYGRMAGVAVRVWGSVPGDGFPESAGACEWDVFASGQDGA